MKARAFAAIMAATGSVVGVGLAAQIPTQIGIPAERYARVDAASYPELLPPPVESYPVAMAPIVLQPRLQLAAWEAPAAEPVADRQDRYDPAEDMASADDAPPDMGGELIPEDEVFDEPSNGLD